MKRIIYILTIALIVFTSCDKNEEILTDESTKLKQEILSFKTTTEYQQTLKKVSRMTDSERKNWENSLGFRSFGTICDEIYSNINPEQFKSFDDLKVELNAKNKYIELNQNNDGDYYADPKELGNNERFLMNEDKMFIVGDKVYRKLNNMLISDLIINISKVKSIKDTVLANSLRKVSPPAGKKNEVDEWSEDSKSDGQTYKMRVRLTTELVVGQGFSRKDTYTFNNYKKVMWLYWGDYLSHTNSDIKTQTRGEFDTTQLPKYLSSGFYSNYEYDVFESYYLWKIDCGNNNPYYQYYKIVCSNARNCSINKTYGTEITPNTPDSFVP